MIEITDLATGQKFNWPRVISIMSWDRNEIEEEILNDAVLVHQLRPERTYGVSIAGRLGNFVLIEVGQPPFMVSIHDPVRPEGYQNPNFDLAFLTDNKVDFYHDIIGYIVPNKPIEFLTMISDLGIHRDVMLRMHDDQGVLFEGKITNIQTGADKQLNFKWL